MYLSANLFHKPKFPEISVTQIWSFFCLKSNGRHGAGKQFTIARAKLSKDLDVTTYLRTVNKVKGIVQCALDDK
jgi:hypothetical protein